MRQSWQAPVSAPAIFIYDRVYMFRFQFLVCVVLSAVIAGGSAAGQSASKASPPLPTIARSAAALAESGHCVEALPALKKSIKVEDKELRRKIGLDGVRCAMTLHQPDAALEFLHLLAREFPQDPDALYESIHAYSDLSSSASQELARTAPSSYQAHELLAESFESQGKWQEAEKEYRGILKQNPSLPGIHFRLGRALLSVPNPTSDAASEAKKEFEQELQIDPSNAGAEYVLGELARQSQQWDEAVKRFSRAAKLDPQFGEAFLGLGSSLLSEKQYADAIAPLERAVKLEPRNPDAHYSLAMAYTRAGRKQDGEKEFAIHQRIIGNDPTPATQPAEAK
ncbi:MAG: tetratricopeptide repeat protein [Candidatus Sulfotelmatobacter sp.]